MGDFLQSNDTMTLVTYGIYAVFGVFFLLGFFRGLMKGLYKSLMDIVFVLAYGAGSFAIARIVSKTFSGAGNMISMIDKIEGISTNNETIVGYLEMAREFLLTSGIDDYTLGVGLALPIAIICPILFVLFYFLLGVVFKIPKWIIERIAFGSDGGDYYRGGNRLIGGLVGGVRNVVAFALVVIPLFGYLYLGNDTMAKFDNIEQVKTIQESYTQPICDNVAVKIVYSSGGKWVFNALTKTKVNETEVSLVKEVEVASDIAVEAMKLQGVEIADYGEDQKEVIDNIVEQVNSDKAIVVPTLIAGGISYVCRQWLNGDNVFGYEKIDVGEQYEPTLDTVLDMFAKTDTASIKKDFTTLGEIVKLAIDSGLIEETTKEEGNVVAVVRSEYFLKNLFGIIYDSDTLRPSLEMISNAIVNYLYQVYDAVNGTQTPWGEQLNLGEHTRKEMEDEGVMISNTIDCFMTFIESADLSGQPIDIVLNADLGALGRGFDHLKTSLLIGNGYCFIVEAVLRSEMVQSLKFVTEDIIQAAINKDQSMETLLVSRQNFVKLTKSILLDSSSLLDKKASQEEIISGILDVMTPETAAALKDSLSAKVIGQFSVGESTASSVSNMLSNFADSSAKVAGGLTAEEKAQEAENINNVMNAVMLANKKGTTSDLFSYTDSDSQAQEGKSAMTASDFVKSVTDSKIMTETIVSSSTNSEGEAVQDPFKIAGKVSAGDKAEISTALQESYAQDDSEENKETLSAIASVFGVDPSTLFGN